MMPLGTSTPVMYINLDALRFLENFDTFRVLTDGGLLGATTVLLLYLFQNGFQFFNTGYASAIAMIFFVILIGLTQAQMRSERQVHY